MENDEKEKERKKGIIVLGAIILIIGSSALLALKYKPKIRQLLNVNKQEVQQDEVQNEEDERYSKLREIFKKDESVLTDLVTEFVALGLMKEEADLHIYLDKNCDGRLKPIAPKQGQNTGEMISNDFFYRVEDDAIIDAAFNKLEREYNGKQFSYNAKTHEIRINIGAEETPFITDNDNLGTMFIYSKEQGLEAKGFHKIKDDWYMWIIPKTEN